MHGGYAFLEETALQYALFQNIVVNLEGTSLFLTHAKRKFAEILGTLIASGGPQRVVWATGAALFHPQPLLEEFWNLEMPRDLVEGYGFPQLTSEMKQAILGGNQARILGLDVPALQSGLASDEYAESARSLREPWSSDYRPPLTPAAAAKVQRSA